MVRENIQVIQRCAQMIGEFSRTFQQFGQMTGGNGWTSRRRG
jgi:hypothetical protein